MHPSGSGPHVGKERSASCRGTEPRPALTRARVRGGRSPCCPLCLSPRDAARQAERVEERAGACVLGAPLLPSPGPGGAGCPVAGRHLLGSPAATTRRHHGNVSALLHAASASGGTPPGSLFWGQERDQGTPDPNKPGLGSAGRPDVDKREAAAAWGCRGGGVRATVASWGPRSARFHVSNKRGGLNVGFTTNRFCSS